MSINFPASSSSQIMVNSTSPPASALYTVIAWMKFTSASISYIISLDSATAGQYCLFGKIIGNLYIDWAGSGSTQTAGPAATTGTWYRYAAVINGTAATLYTGTATSQLSVATQSANYVQPTGTLSWKLGGSTANSNNAAGELANVKIYNAALTQQEIEEEMWQYLPKRTANISRWYPLVVNELNDWSGMGRTLTGGTGVTTTTGPPISWGGNSPLVYVPWDPTTQEYYAVYYLSDGSLFSVGPELASPLDPAFGYKEYIGTQPDMTEVVWDPNALDFVNLASIITVDRVQDLVNDATIAAVWADLTAPNSALLQSRLATFMGPYRYRAAGDSVDL